MELYYKRYPDRLMYLYWVFESYILYTTYDFIQDLRQFVKSTVLSLPAKITSLTLFPTPALQT